MTLIPGATLELYRWRPDGWLRHWCFVLFYGFFMALACNTVCTSMVLQIKLVIDVVGFS